MLVCLYRKRLNLEFFFVKIDKKTRSLFYKASRDLNEMVFYNKLNFINTAWFNIERCVKLESNEI